MKDETQSSRIKPAAHKVMDFTLAPFGWIVLFVAAVFVAGLACGIWFVKG